MREGFDGSFLAMAHRAQNGTKKLQELLPSANGEARCRMADEGEFTVVWRGGDLLGNNVFEWKEECQILRPAERRTR
jgi:hypothetical protein